MDSDAIKDLSKLENLLSQPQLPPHLQGRKELGDGTTTLDAKDLGNCIFNYPLEIYIQGLDSATEARTTKATIVEHCSNRKPAIVYSKEAKLSAIDLVAYSGGTPPLEDIEPLVGVIRDEELKSTLRCGVGFIHNGSSSLDQQVVSRLFEARIIQVCVISSSLCWVVPLSAHLVVIMGYEGHESEYASTDLLQMMSHASRLFLDNPGKCVFLSHAHPKEYRKKFSFEPFVIKNDMDLSASHLGRIASRNYIMHRTVERFSAELDANTKMKGLLEVLSQAFEYAQLPVRHSEEDLLRRLINHQRFSFVDPNCIDPHVKANALLQAHFSRHQVNGNLALDQKEVLGSAIRLLQAMVELTSSNGWLDSSLLAMKVSQMVSQAMWERDPNLLQLPHFTKGLAKKFQRRPQGSVESVKEFLAMDDDERQEMLQMTDSQLLDIAFFLSEYPSIHLAYNVLFTSSWGPGNTVTLVVTLVVTLTKHVTDRQLSSDRYRKANEAWLMVGDATTDSLLAIERVTLDRNQDVKLDFKAPLEIGMKPFNLYLVSDSYFGCDQEYRFYINVDSI